MGRPLRSVKFLTPCPALERLLITLSVNWPAPLDRSLSSEHRASLEGRWGRRLAHVSIGSCVTSIAGPNGMRNYTGDEGRPFEVGDQVPVSSHRKLLSSKAMVVSVVEKPGQRLKSTGNDHESRPQRRGIADRLV